MSTPAQAPTFEVTFVDCIEDIPEWITGRDRANLEDCNYERMSEEGRSTLVVKIGDRIHIHRDGGEPEDNTFCRDWYWVSGLIADAYAQGVMDGIRQNRRENQAAV